ncbi:hypothetical protein BJ742DRAFT_288288 [Cladochytrium replicatum]|nr:hypothetical protein BJ742DRAFT_288288 [Cladochytrium replicatum]
MLSLIPIRREMSYLWNIFTTLLSRLWAGISSFVGIGLQGPSTVDRGDVAGILLQKGYIRHRGEEKGDQRNCKVYPRAWGSLQRPSDCYVHGRSHMKSFKKVLAAQIQKNSKAKLCNA